jgi:hypothetical protein
MLRERRILIPWLASAVVMFGLSYLWHGVALNDLRELRTPIGLYVVLSGLVYLVIGLGITVLMHQCIRHEWISLKQGFPLKGMLLGAVVGFVVFLVAFIFGMSFTDRHLVHVLADVAWQMVEQALGGLVVSLGIIYDLHQTFLENERAN